MTDAFQSRFQDALRRRLYPSVPLYLKEVAQRIGRSENTVARWWRGETRVSGDDLYQLAHFFASRGDRNFLREIFFDALADLPSVNERSTVIAVARELLAEAGELTPVAGERCAWVTAAGDLEPAPHGHAHYVSNTLRLPATHGDLLAYAARVLGWMGITEHDEGRIRIWHDSRRVAPLAVERICEWLEEHAGQIHRVQRMIGMDGRWVEADHTGAQRAAAAIERVAALVRIPRRRWTVKRLPLESVRNPLLMRLLKAHRQAPQTLIHAAAKMGAFTTSNLFGVDGDDVISHHVGTDLGFDPAFEGLNILARADTEYAMMVQARILQAHREGPTYYELTGTIDDRNARYLNLALPIPEAIGRVLTSSDVLEVERLSS